MKQSLTAIVLLIAIQVQSAHADISLEYSLSFKQTQQAVQYQLKGHMLRLNDNGPDRINLFDASKQHFVSLDTQSGQVSQLNMQILEGRVRQLKATHQKKVREVEAQLKQKTGSMNKQEQEIAESMLNQMRYPDLYGEHTLLTLSQENTQKTIAGVPCHVYAMRKRGELIKSFCVSAPGHLNMTKQEYLTLRAFYQFDYETQSQLMLAIGKSHFDLVDYEKSGMPGVIIETIIYRDDNPVQTLQLIGFDNKTLDEKLFQVPSRSTRDHLN